MISKGVHVEFIFKINGGPSIPTSPQKNNSGGANVLYCTACKRLIYGIRAASGLPALKFDCLASVQKNMRTF